MKIKDLFRGDIERPIETVIHVDLSDEQIVADEIDEYVVTDNIRRSLHGGNGCSRGDTPSALPPGGRVAAD